MSILFHDYNHIEAESLIRRSIRRDEVTDDLQSLISNLISLNLINRFESKSSGVQLNKEFLQKLRTQSEILKLLPLIGYKEDQSGSYIFHSAGDLQEINERQQIQEELKKLIILLKECRKNRRNELVTFLSVTDNAYSYHTYDRIETDHIHTNSDNINQCNQRTLTLVSKLKKQMTGPSDRSTTTAFMRRKLAFDLLKEVVDGLQHADEDIIDLFLTNYIETLRQRSNTSQKTDEECLECLIRTKFEVDKAAKMIRENCPVLKPPKPRNSDEDSNEPISLKTSRPHLNRLWSALTHYTEQDSNPVTLLFDGDEWKKTVHILEAVSKIRRTHDNSCEQVIFRLLFSEFSTNVRHFKIYNTRALASAMSKLDLDALERVTVADLKDVMNYEDTLEDSIETRIQAALGISCLICGDIFPRSCIESIFLCGHKCCTACLRGYYQGVFAEITDANSLSKLTCYQAHDLPNDPDIRLNFFPHLENLIRRLFPDQRALLDRYHENLFFATKTTGMLKCINPKCPDVFEVPNRDGRRSVRCPTCQYDQCAHCRRKWLADHQNISCDDYADWLADNDPDDPQVQLNRYLETAGIACPNPECQEVFEYEAGGCEHFTCPKCRTEFCRICSNYFYNPTHNTRCPRPNCLLVNTVHAHCAVNCYREIRDAGIDRLLEFLEENDVDWREELQQKPVSTGINCPVNGCNQPVSGERENRFCERCFVQFICLLIWRRQLEPWELYEDRHLRVQLGKVEQNFPEETPREQLIENARIHLTQFLGQPRRFVRQR